MVLPHFGKIVKYPVNSAGGTYWVTIEGDTNKFKNDIAVKVYRQEMRKAWSPARLFAGEEKKVEVYSLLFSSGQVDDNDFVPLIKETVRTYENSEKSNHSARSALEKINSKRLAKVRNWDGKIEG